MQSAYVKRAIESNSHFEDSIIYQDGSIAAQ